MIQAIGWAALAPFADGLGADAVALGEKARGFGGAGDLGPGDWGGAGVGMDLQHGSDLVLSGLGQAFEAIGMFYDGQADRIPTMSRNLTARAC
jgi:hypothetical protein